MTEMDGWIKVSEKLPPEGVAVETKTGEGDPCPDSGRLRRRGNLWFLPDKNVYVYYTPTYWRN